MPIYALDGNETRFPDPNDAEPDGLLAVGGELTATRVLSAYRAGVFPWPIPGAPLTWFSPDPRMVLDFENLRVTRSLRKTLRRAGFRVTFDDAFSEVMEACATVPRDGQQGSWITDGMRRAYGELHAHGWAHSVEVWQDERLVGGLYGVSIGRMFCGESMFHRATDASKVAFVSLARRLEATGFAFLDCQLHTPHLESLGAKTVPRAAFLRRLSRAVDAPSRRGNWPNSLAENGEENGVAYEGKPR